jgi:DNA processing protein
MREVSVNERVRLARIALHWLIEPGNEAVHRMVNANGPLRALERLVEGDVPDPQLRGAAAARMGAGDPHEVAEAALVRAERLGARIVIPEDDEWPQPVRDLTRLLGRPAEHRIDRDVAPPLCLWVRGAPRLDEALARSVAVVGARASTHYGEHVATTLAYELAEREWTIVSGGAHGIDAAAHRGALNAGGLTVAVLACGVDKPYPSGNTGLFDRIADVGLLVSEWPPGSVPVRHRFLIRNRVIAAATRGTVVVEASARSGASQTLRRAIALGRRPMVVPGPVTSAMSVGCHELLRDRPEVRLVTGAAHVLEEIGQIGGDLAPRPRGPERPHDGLDVEAAMVLESVPRRGAAGPDELAARAGLDIRTAMRKLTLLESLGFVARRGGGYRIATKPSSPKAGAAPPEAGAAGPASATAGPHPPEAGAAPSDAGPPPPEAGAAPSEAGAAPSRAGADPTAARGASAKAGVASSATGPASAKAGGGRRAATRSRAPKEREAGAAP